VIDNPFTGTVTPRSNVSKGSGYPPVCSVAITDKKLLILQVIFFKSKSDIEHIIYIGDNGNLPIMDEASLPLTSVVAEFDCINNTSNNGCSH